MTDAEKKAAIDYWNSNSEDETGYINTIKRRLNKICLYEDRDCYELYPILEKVLREQPHMICDKCLLNANFNIMMGCDNNAKHFKLGLLDVNNSMTCFRDKKICKCLLVQIFNNSSVFEHTYGFVGSRIHKDIFPEGLVKENWCRFSPTYVDADFRVIGERVVQIEHRTLEMVVRAGDYKLDESNFEEEVNPGEDFQPMTLNQSIQLERESARLGTSEIYYLRKEIQKMQDAMADFDKVSRYFYHNVAEQIVGHYYKKNQAAIVNEGFAEIMDMIASR